MYELQCFLVFPCQKATNNLTFLFLAKEGVKIRKSIRRYLCGLRFFFLVVETTFRHIFPSGELQCLSHGDLRNLCANTRILLLATHSLMMYDRAVSRCEQRGCQSFHWLVFFGEAIKRDTNFFSQDHEAVLGLRSQSKWDTLIGNGISSISLLREKDQLTIGGAKTERQKREDKKIPNSSWEMENYHLYLVERNWKRFKRQCFFFLVQWWKTYQLFSNSFNRCGIRMGILHKNSSRSFSWRTALNDTVLTEE